MARWDADPPHPPEQVRGATDRIVNVASINALVTRPNKPADIAAKYGLLVLTKAVAFRD